MKSSFINCTRFQKPDADTGLISKIKIFLVLILLLGAAKFSNAQCPGHNGPSCNFFGPLVACVGTMETDTITVSYGSTLPEFTFKFLINGTGGSTNGVVTPFGGFTDSTFQGTVIINNGSTSGSEDIQVTVYVTFSDGCTDSTICTKSVTVIDVEATTQFAPIVCKGGTTTLNVTGSGGSLYQYTLLPSGPTNNTGVFPGLHAGTYSVEVQGESFVQKTDTCTKIITGINIPDGSGGIVYALCAPVKVETSCTSASAVSADFTAWKALFHDSAAAGVTITYNSIRFSSSSPPDACSGGTVTGIDSVFSACDTNVCTSTFSTTASPIVSIHCANDTTVASCQTQSAVNAEFAAWLLTAKGSGGCNGVMTNSSNSAPDACAGGIATVTFNYTSTCAPLSTTCIAHFTVTASPAVSLHCANDTTVTSCQTQASVNAEFAAWLLTARASGGCNGQLSNNGNNIGAPNACTGGTTTVTFNYTSTCAPLSTTCTARFTVTAAPPVTLTCPNDTTVASCQSPTQINNEFATWLGRAKGSGGCNGQLSNNGNSVGTPNACSGGTATVTFTYTSSCANQTTTCTAHFTVTASPALTLTIPPDTTVACCQTQTQVNAEFAKWVAEAKIGGGCGIKLTLTGNTAPNNCGGSQLVTFTVTDTICGATKSLSATFNVPAPPPLFMTVPPDTTVLGTQLASDIAAEYQHWLTEVSGGGGTGGTKITNNAPANPPACGANVTVTFTITDTICPNTLSKPATFTVGPCPSFWGCTLGFWKNHTAIWDDPSDAISSCLATAIALQGYSGNGTSGSSFASTFGLTSAQMSAVGLSPSLTLEGALQSGGGGYNLLVRQGVAALINTCGLSGHYTYTSAYVLTSIHMAIVTKSPSPLGDEFGNANEVQPDNCPPGGPAKPHGRLMNDAISMNDNVTISAYPNPFDNMTTIEVLPNIDYSEATVELYGLDGQKVSTLYAGPVQAEQTYRFAINGANLAAGIYIYSFRAGEDNIFGKVVLIK